MKLLLAGMVLLLPSTSAYGAGGAMVNLCVPDTLGSDAFRKHQVCEFFDVKITQPYNGGLCLTATDVYTVQRCRRTRVTAGARARWGIVMAACGKQPNANNTWERAQRRGADPVAGPADLLRRHRRVRERPRLSGAHVAVHGGCARRSAAVQCPNPKCTCVASQRFSCTKTGNVLALNSGLCLDTGSNTGASSKACDVVNTSAFCDRSLSYYERAQALVATANLTEQIANLRVGQPGFPLQHVQPFTADEALHGVCKVCGQAAPGSTGCATSFPHATALGASFNRSLWSMVGDVIGLEGRAMQNGHGGEGPSGCGVICILRQTSTCAAIQGGVGAWRYPAKTR